MKIPASATKGKKCAAAHRLPVSQKFYNEISARIRSSFASVSPSDALAESAICCVESYLREGLLPSGAVVESVRLMFALLRPEIDKAMARSAAARRRRRKPQTDATVTGGAENEPSSESISDAIPESVREMAGSDYDPEKLANIFKALSRPFDEDEEHEDDEEAGDAAPAVMLNRRQRRRQERLQRRDARRLAKRR
ncbi:hypothetical protein [Duncaniella muris]|uniref:Uncharacterized protein n=1 Tax=Duncaniella muris TaxID=2094150 RepID=A0A2V1IRD9_9BACT|nr:hypothetical protein [Duncaniella muris]PWB02693.1 hypothetical protein C5O23_05595 [Duncaniella muris]